MMMNTSETISLIFAILLGVCAMIAGLVVSNAADNRTLTHCIEKTGKPLECKASFRH